jgi:hypothetical protein
MFLTPLHSSHAKTGFFTLSHSHLVKTDLLTLTHSRYAETNMTFWLRPIQGMMKPTFCTTTHSNHAETDFLTTTYSSHAETDFLDHYPFQPARQLELNLVTTSLYYKDHVFAFSTLLLITSGLRTICSSCSWFLGVICHHFILLTSKCRISQFLVYSTAPSVQSAGTGRDQHCSTLMLTLPH